MLLAAVVVRKLLEKQRKVSFASLMKVNEQSYVWTDDVCCSSMEKQQQQEEKFLVCCKLFRSLESMIK
jgi:hypothetical protein